MKWSKQLQQTIGIMRVCILDPQERCPGLKVLLPQADYFCQTSIPWDTLSSETYPVVCFVDRISDMTVNGSETFGKYRTLLIQQTFQKVLFFDMDESDADPTEINNDLRVDIYLKNQYTTSKSYDSSVIAFPYLTKGGIETLLQQNLSPEAVRKTIGCYTGTLPQGYEPCGGILQKLSDDYSLEQLRQTAVFVNFSPYPTLGMFQAIANGVLVLNASSAISWGFYPGDAFPSETIFSTPEDFLQKYQRLLTDAKLYLHCLTLQNYLAEKYFTKDFLSNMLRVKMGIHDRCSILLTACKRPDLLRYTLETFLKFNTYPIEEAIILEDSGIEGIDDFAKEMLPFPTKILYAKKNRGVMRSIENGVQYIRTPYVFHCEDDWEFYDYGFIERSMDILKKEPLMTSPWLRSYQDINLQNLKYTVHDKYIMFAAEVGNTISHNPGLRKTPIEKMFAPYTSDKLRTLCEGGLCDAFQRIGMRTGLTDNPNGFVRHSGMGRRVYNTLGVEQFTH